MLLKLMKKTISLLYSAVNTALTHKSKQVNLITRFSQKKKQVFPFTTFFGGKEHLEKAEKIFKKLDCILFDIQDIGTRYYTYQYTLLDALHISKKTIKN